MLAADSFHVFTRSWLAVMVVVCTGAGEERNSNHAATSIQVLLVES